MQSKIDIRPSPIAGQWYPADPRQLAASIDGYLNLGSSPAVDDEIVAVVVPHAGHLYSGPVACYAFRLLCGLEPEIVAIVSPMHYPYPQPLLTSDHSAYQTPLGLVPIARAAVRELDEILQSDLGCGLYAVRNDLEHSIEIQLPFLQRSLAGSFLLLPIMIREQSDLLASCLGRTLARLLANRLALLIASTDLSHFYPQALANQLDAEVLRRVEAFDPQGLMEVEEQGVGYACGLGALAAVMWAARDLGADNVKILQHATSGDVTGDYDQVVGYGSAVLTRGMKIK